MCIHWADPAALKPNHLVGCSDHDSSVFETTIRVVGGLLAAHDLSGDAMFARRCGPPCSIYALLDSIDNTGRLGRAEAQREHAVATDHQHLISVLTGCARHGAAPRR